MKIDDDDRTLIFTVVYIGLLALALGCLALALPGFLKDAYGSF